MADDNQKSRNILENSNFLKHRCCLEDRAFLSNSIELVQRENFLALVDTDGKQHLIKVYIYLTVYSYTVRDFKNLCHMVGFPICVRDLPENEAKVPNFNANFDH